MKIGSSSRGGDTAADDDLGSRGETVAPRPYVLGAVAGPLSVDDVFANGVSSVRHAATNHAMSPPTEASFDSGVFVPVSAAAR